MNLGGVLLKKAVCSTADGFLYVYGKYITACLSPLSKIYAGFAVMHPMYWNS
jgi:hypothetical protein